MNMNDFYDRIEAHQDLTGVGIDTPEAHTPCVLIQHKPSGMVTRLPVAALEKADWSAIEEVLTCQREPQALQHMTRVVGYYSRVENWNKSKIGELKDRHKGNYAVEAQPALVG